MPVQLHVPEPRSHAPRPMHVLGSVAHSAFFASIKGLKANISSHSGGLPRDIGLAFLAALQRICCAAAMEVRFACSKTHWSMVARAGRQSYSASCRLRGWGWAGEGEAAERG